MLGYLPNAVFCIPQTPYMCNDPLFSLQDKFWPEKMTSKLAIFFLFITKPNLFLIATFPAKPTVLYSLDPIECSRTFIFIVPAETKVSEGDYGIGPFRPSVYYLQSFSRFPELHTADPVCTVMVSI